MIFFQDDRFFNTQYKVDEGAPKAIEYDNTGVINYNSLYFENENGDEMPLFYNNETKRYINIRYEHMSVDWNLDETSEGYK